MKECVACFEQGPEYAKDRQTHSGACRDYARQRVWNKKMSTLLGREPEEAPIPKAPTYTMAELERWAVRESVTERMPNLWWRETWALLQTDGKAYRDFKKACEKGVPSESL